MQNKIKSKTQSLTKFSSVLRLWTRSCGSQPNSFSSLPHAFASLLWLYSNCHKIYRIVKYISLRVWARGVEQAPKRARGIWNKSFERARGIWNRSFGEKSNKHYQELGLGPKASYQRDIIKMSCKDSRWVRTTGRKFIFLCSLVSLLFPLHKEPS